MALEKSGTALGLAELKTGGLELAKLPERLELPKETSRLTEKLSVEKQ